MTVVVENDVLRPDDPKSLRLLSSGSAVVADGTLFHVADAASLRDSSVLRQILSQASGYPLNAFVLRRGAAERLVEWVAHEDAGRLVDALTASVHSVFDGEGYVAWVRRSPADR